MVQDLLEHATIHILLGLVSPHPLFPTPEYLSLSLLMLLKGTEADPKWAKMEWNRRNSKGGLYK